MLIVVFLIHRGDEFPYKLQNWKENNITKYKIITEKTVFLHELLVFINERHFFTFQDFGQEIEKES